jgi:PPOX class probable F420-dependent enzyme
VTDVDEGVRQLFGEGRNYASLATLMADGSPHAVSIWVGVEGENVVFFTSPTSLKGRNIARDPRVALSIVDRENPFRTAQVRGEVVETRTGDAAMEVVDRLSQRYVGYPFPQRDTTLYVVAPSWQKFTELPFAEPADPAGA